MRDYAKLVATKKYKNSMGEMFSVEIALLKKTLLKWFNAKYKRNFLVANPVEKLRYETKHKVNMQKSKCTICKFLLKLEITQYDNPQMTYGDYIVRFEYKFLQNIFEEDDLIGQIRDLKHYYDFFKHYINVCLVCYLF